VAPFVRRGGPGALFVHAAYLLATLVLLIFLDEMSSR
jgi:hypothetical protein